MHLLNYKPQCLKLAENCNIIVQSGASFIPNPSLMTDAENWRLEIHRPHKKAVMVGRGMMVGEKWRWGWGIQVKSKSCHQMAGSVVTVGLRNVLHPAFASAYKKMRLSPWCTGTALSLGIREAGSHGAVRQLDETELKTCRPTDERK